MKTQSNEPIAPVQAIGEGKFYVHTNIVQKTREAGPDNAEPTQYYEADTVTVNELTYDAIIVAMLRQNYTISQEVAFINNYLASGMIATSPEGIEYLAYQDCRNVAKEAARLVMI
jgi:hypothetical protein